MEANTESKVSGKARPREETQKGGPQKTAVRNPWPAKSCGRYWAGMNT